MAVLQSGKRYDVTGFGESMLRLSVPTGMRLVAMQSLDVHFAGAESNVLATLACLGRRCGWFGALPEGQIGRYAIQQLHTANITPHPIFVPNGRLGTFFIEFAVPPRSTQVVYDRDRSAITTLDPSDIDYADILDTRLLHLCGITPALSSNCLAITRELIARAKAANVAVSFDVNFRSKLWSAADAGETLLPLMQSVDLLLCGKRDAEALFGCAGHVETIIEQLASQTHAQQIVVTNGEAGVYGWDGVDIHHAPARPVTIIDRVGAGDALAGGVLHGWLDGDLAKGLHYGTLMAALALSQYGDMVVSSAEEVEYLLNMTDHMPQITR